MMSKFKDAQDIGLGLIRYVQTLLPITISKSDAASDPAIQLQWIPVRLAGTLESVLLLGKSDRHEDSAALVRVMADHLIVFGWLLADEKPPERINAWKNDDVRHIHALRNNLVKLKVDGDLPDSLGKLDTSTTWVSAETAARQCDEFWEPKLIPFFQPGTVLSFRGLYAAVFRRTSPYVHPSLRGSTGFFTTPNDEDGRVFFLNQSHADLPMIYVHAVVIELLAVWILAARFRHKEVKNVLPFFDRVVSKLFSVEDE